MQFVQRRIADVAMDLYALAACMSRATQAIERHGTERAWRHIDYTRVFASDAERRLHANFDGFEANDDELRKAIAVRTYEDGAYALDVI